MSEPLTVTALTAVEINGEFYTYKTVKRVINACQLEPDDKDARGNSLYDVTKFSEAAKSYFKDKKKSQVKKSPELTELKLKKLQEDIAKSQLEQERLIQEKDRAQLEIKEMKRKLVESDDVRQYLLTRHAVEMALLRRILLTNVPIELTGLDDKIQARLKCEEYLHLCEDVFGATHLIWEQTYCEDKKELPQSVQVVIDKLNTIFNEPTNQNHTGS